MSESKARAGASRAPVIAGVRTKPLRLVPDERGWVMEILRADDRELFTKFGQVDVSAVYPGVVKAWHGHRAQADNVASVLGMIKLVLVNTRPGSPTEGVVNEFVVGSQQPTLVQIPSLVDHGWTGIGEGVALVVNAPDEPYRDDDPDEIRIEPHGTLPYDWSRQDG